MPRDVRDVKKHPRPRAPARRRDDVYVHRLAILLRQREEHLARENLPELLVDSPNDRCVIDKKRQASNRTLHSGTRIDEPRRQTVVSLPPSADARVLVDVSRTGIEVHPEIGRANELVVAQLRKVLPFRRLRSRVDAEESYVRCRRVHQPESPFEPAYHVYPRAAKPDDEGRLYGGRHGLSAGLAREVLNVASVGLEAGRSGDLLCGRQPLASHTHWLGSWRSVEPRMSTFVPCFQANDLVTLRICDAVRALARVGEVHDLRLDRCDVGVSTDEPDQDSSGEIGLVSYTHLTLP